MQLPHYLALLAGAEQTLADAHRAVAAAHAADADVAFGCAGYAEQAGARAEVLAPVRDRYTTTGPEPERLHPPALEVARAGPVGLLRDLADLHQLATFLQTNWGLVGQAAHGARDQDLIALCASSGSELEAQLAWLRTRMRSEAAQALLVAE